MLSQKWRSRQFQLAYQQIISGFYEIGISQAEIPTARALNVEQMLSVLARLILTAERKEGILLTGFLVRKILRESLDLTQWKKYMWKCVTTLYSYVINEILLWDRSKTSEVLQLFDCLVTSRSSLSGVSVPNIYPQLLTTLKLSTIYLFLTERFCM